MSRMRLSAALLLLGATSSFFAPAHAERPVYRGLDANGGAVYSDRADGTAATRLRGLPAGPSSHEYESARARAQRDELDYGRARLEARESPAIVVYQPSPGGLSVSTAISTTGEIQLLPPGHDLPPPAPRVRARRDIRHAAP